VAQQPIDGLKHLEREPHAELVVADAVIFTQAGKNFSRRRVFHAVDRDGFPIIMGRRRAGLADRVGIAAGGRARPSS